MIRPTRWFWLAWPLLAGLAFAARQFLATLPNLVEQGYSAKIFPAIANPLARLSSAMPFSMMEIALLLAAVLLPVFFVIWLVRLIREDGRLARLGRLLRNLTIITSILFLVFMFLHGFNYARLPVAESFNLPVRERGLADLQDTAGG
jgi:hypothetical protein